VVLVVVTTEAVAAVEQRLLAAVVLDLTHPKARLLMVAMVVLVLMLYLLGLQQQALAHQDIMLVAVAVMASLFLVEA
jgi:hypothetical protein